MLAALRQSGGINALARQLGASPRATAAAVETLLPDLLAGFRNFEGGMGSLVALLGELGGSSLASAVMNPEPADPAPGQAILQRLDRAFIPASPGANDDDRQLRERMLPLLTMLAGGYAAARAATDDLSPGELQALLVPGQLPKPPAEDHV